MLETKIIRPSVDAIVKMMRRDRMPVTVVYDKVKSTPTIMDDTYAHVLKYRKYALSISFV